MQVLWKLQNTNMNSGIAENSQKVHFLILESQWLISIRSLDTVKGNNTLCWTPGRVNDKTLLLSSELLSWMMSLSQSHLLGIDPFPTGTNWGLEHLPFRAKWACQLAHCGSMIHQTTWQSISKTKVGGWDVGWPNLSMAVGLFNDVLKRSTEQKYE